MAGLTERLVVAVWHRVQLKLLHRRCARPRRALVALLLLAGGGHLLEKRLRGVASRRVVRRPACLGRALRHLLVARVRLIFQDGFQRASWRRSSARENTPSCLLSLRPTLNLTGPLLLRRVVLRSAGRLAFRVPELLDHGQSCSCSAFFFVRGGRHLHQVNRAALRGRHLRSLSERAPAAALRELRECVGFRCRVQEMQR